MTEPRNTWFRRRPTPAQLKGRRPVPVTSRGGSCGPELRGLQAAGQSRVPWPSSRRVLSTSSRLGWPPADTRAPPTFPKHSPS